MRRQWKWTSALVLVLATVASMSFAQDQQLRIAVASWMLEKTPIESAAAEFEQNNPGVVVVIETLASEFDTSLIPALRTDSPPYDLLMPYSGGDAAPFAELGLLAPWDNVFNNPDFQVNGHELSRSDFVAGFLQQSEYDGQILSLPVFGEVMALTIRTDILEEAGISGTPSSWTQVEETCAEVGGPFLPGFSAELSRGRNTITSLFGIALSNGGSVLDEEGRFNLLAPETVEAMEFLIGLNTEHNCAQSNAVDQWDASRTNFLRGNVAQFYAWASWGTQAILPEEIFGENAIAIVSPPGAAEHGTILYTGGAIIPRTGNVEMAQKFTVEMVQSKEFQQWYATRYGKSPVLAENYEGLPEDLWGQIEEMTTRGTSMPSYLNFTEMTNVFQNYFDQAWRGQITPREALEATEEEIASLY